MNEQTKKAAMQYLDDVNDSLPGVSGAYLQSLTIEAFALTPAEAKAVYREWSKTE